MGEAVTHASQRELAIGVLLEIAQDPGSTVEEKLQAASMVIDATGPQPSQTDQDAALRVVGDQVAVRVLQHLEENVQFEPQGGPDA